MTADPGSTPGVERSFVLVRVVRSSLLVVFVVLAVVGVEARGWSHWITIGLAALGLLLVARLARDVRRLATIRAASVSAPGGPPPPAHP